MKTQNVEPKSVRQETIKRAMGLVESLFAVVPTSEIEQLTTVLQPQRISDEQIELAKKIAGDDYSDEPSWNLELANLHDLYQRRRELLKNSLTSTEVADLLGLKTRKTIHDRMQAKSILGIKDKGTYRFPIWQFDPEGDDGVLNGLPDVLKALHASDFTKLNWLMSPHPAMDGKTPIETIEQGELGRVLVEARGVNIF